MKKIKSNFTLLLFIFSFSFSFSQVQSQADKQSIGWYQLLEGSSTKILMAYDKSSTDVYYACDEVLLVFDFKGRMGYAIDIDGRIVLIENVDKIKKIEIPGRVVKMTKNVNISLNKLLSANNNVWLIGYNSVNNSAKIALSSGEIVEIPKETFIDIREQLENIGSINKYYNTSCK